MVPGSSDHVLQVSTGYNLILVAFEELPFWLLHILYVYLYALSIEHQRGIDNMDLRNKII